MNAATAPAPRPNRAARRLTLARKAPRQCVPDEADPPLHDPLKKGSGGFRGEPPQKDFLNENHCFMGLAESYVFAAVLKQIYADRSTDRNGRRKDPKAWTGRMTDKQIAKIGGCDVRMANEIKYHLFESGIFDARRKGNSWQFSPHVCVKNWHKIKKWTPRDRTPLESRSKEETEGEQEAKKPCNRLQSRIPIAAGKFSRPFRVAQTGQTIRAHNPSPIAVEVEGLAEAFESVANAALAKANNDPVDIDQHLDVLIRPMPTAEAAGPSANTSPPPDPQIPQKGAYKKGSSVAPAPPASHQNRNKPSANEQFGSLLSVIQQAGMRHTDAEVSRPYGEVWKAFFALPFNDRLSAIKGIGDRLECGQYQPHNLEQARFIPRALKYLEKRLWTEGLMPNTGPRKSAGKPTTDWAAIKRSLK